MNPTTQEQLALAEEIIYKALFEIDSEKVEDPLAGAYRAIGKARRELRRINREASE